MESPTRGHNRSVNAVEAPKSATKKSGTRPKDQASPVIAQYLEIKAVNPGYLMMMQLGDFYELFFEDAVMASQRLGLTLTKRGTYQGKDIPMAGVPISTINQYLQKAIEAGFRVAIIDQLEDPAEAKKRGNKAIVKRDVTRLVTPGTLTEDSLLDQGANNFLTSIFQNPSEHNSKEQSSIKTGATARKNQTTLYSLASLDISTGEFIISEATNTDLGGELSRLSPSEIIISDAIIASPQIKTNLINFENSKTPVPHAYFSSLSGEDALKKILKVEELEAFGNFTRGELAAISALLKYVELTQIGKQPVIRPPSKAGKNSHMVIDAATRANLELVKSTRLTKKGSLFDAIDRTVTGPGARALASKISAPLHDADAINQRLNALEFFISHSALRDKLRKILRATPDISRALSRLSLKRGGPKDLGAIQNGLNVADALNKELETIKPDHQPAALKQQKADLLFASGRLRDQLNSALKDELPLQARDGDFIIEGYNSTLDEERMLRDKSRSILAELQAKYRDDTGIKSLKIRHNNQFGYFVEVTQINASTLLTGPLSETFRHRQTLANNVRFNTSQLIETESKITMAAERALALEKQLFDQLSDSVASKAGKISAVAHSLAELDVTLGLAMLSEEENYTRPIVDNSTTFLIKNGRHPVVEQALRADKSGPFIDNDCELAKTTSQNTGKYNSKNTANIWILTGPNMAGKSTFLRQNALIAILAQMGCYVPASKAHIGLIDRLFSRVGASDDLARGRSTFMVEMVETAAILNQATNKSLIILDEIGRGTATFDGLSIAWATLEYLHNHVKARALFATHYHELTCLREKLDHITNATIEVKEWNDEIVFLHRVIKGAADRSYGIQVAKLAGLPPPVIRRANEVLTRLESESEKKGAINQLDDLPLFSMESPSTKETIIEPPADPIAEELRNELKAINPDDLTPKVALDLLYKLKTISDQ